MKQKGFGMKFKKGKKCTHPDEGLTEVSRMKPTVVRNENFQGGQAVATQVVHSCPCGAKVIKTSMKPFDPRNN